MLGPPTRRFWSQAPSSASRKAILPVRRPSCLRTLWPRRGARENLRAGERPQIKVVVERGAGKGTTSAVHGDAGGVGAVTWLQKLGLATSVPIELLSYTSRALSRRERSFGLLPAVDGVCPGGRGNAARPDASSSSPSS
eukprot:scaffold8191_cov67-Phaeocystis_antarctica.AAC.3